MSTHPDLATLGGWGVDAESLVPLGGDVELTYQVEAGDGTRYALKVGKDPERLDATARILDRLDGRLGEVETPRVVRARDGATTVAIPGGWSQLHRWVSGTPMRELRRRSPALLQDWGAVAAHLVRALDGLEAVPDGHGWDLDSAVRAVGDEVEAVRHWVSLQVLDELAGMERVVVHHDLNDSNVLAAPDELGRHRVVGVLDVGDVVRAPAVTELAVAAAYALRSRERPLEALEAMVSGWTSVRPLTEAEAALVYPLAVLRLAHVATTWRRRAAEGDYAAARLAGSWEALDRLAALPAAVAETVVRRAAGLGLAVRPAPAPLSEVPIVVGHGQPATGSRRRSGHDEPATLRLGVEVAAELEPGVEQCEDAHGAWWRVVRAVPGGSHVQHWLVRPPEDPPVLVPPSELAAWSVVCVDPLGSGGEAVDVVSLRQAHVARSQRAYYDRPMVLASAQGMWFEDRDGLRYLDAVNNVTHVGHAHPDVVAAGARQMATLNTNSRFVYPGLAEYASRLTSTLPDGLDVVLFTCTGSEANDLALRIARTVTDREHVVVIGGAYHGNTIAVTGISPNRFRGPGGTGPPPTTHETDQPDRYRGRHRGEDAGERYTADALDLVRSLVHSGRAPAAMFAEPLQGTGGQIVLPAGYLASVFDEVRLAGGLCVADEVQVGFGRLGHSFWGFQGHGVVPDIVTMGKPMGNGHPMSAVVTTREIADAFDNGMRYFNTFGGNPVSCAIGSAVLDVIERDGLQENARVIGGYLLRRLRELVDRHRLVGDVRGEGLYIGVELVRDRDTLEPADAEARIVAERMKEEGVITYPNGTFENVLKLKPPMIAGGADADLIADTLDEVLADGW